MSKKYFTFMSNTDNPYAFVVVKASRNHRELFLAWLGPDRIGEFSAEYDEAEWHQRPCRKYRHQEPLVIINVLGEE